MMVRKFDLDEMAKGIVYLKPVNVDELPIELQDSVEGAERVFSVHNDQGDNIALVDTAELAMSLAEMHQMRAVYLH